MRRVEDGAGRRDANHAGNDGKRVANRKNEAGKAWRDQLVIHRHAGARKGIGRERRSQVKHGQRRIDERVAEQSEKDGGHNESKELHVIARLLGRPHAALNDVLRQDARTNRARALKEEGRDRDKPNIVKVDVQCIFEIIGHPREQDEKGPSRRKEINVKRPELLGRKQEAPRNARRRCAGRATLGVGRGGRRSSVRSVHDLLLQIRLDECNLVRVNVAVKRRRVGDAHLPRHQENKTESAKKVKHKRPAPRGNHGRRKQHGDDRAKVRARREEGDGAAELGRRKPHRHELMHGRPRHALGDTEKDAARDERRVRMIRGPRRQHGKERPKQGGASHDALAAIPAAEESAGNAREEVADEKGRQNPTLISVAPIEFVRHLNNGHTYIGAIAVIDGDREKTQNDELVAPRKVGDRAAPRARVAAVVGVKGRVARRGVGGARGDIDRGDAARLGILERRVSRAVRSRLGQRGHCSETRMWGCGDWGHG